MNLEKYRVSQNQTPKRVKSNYQIHLTIWNLYKSIKIPRNKKKRILKVKKSENRVKRMRKAIIGNKIESKTKMMRIKIVYKLKKPSKLV